MVWKAITFLVQGPCLIKLACDNAKYQKRQGCRTSDSEFRIQPDHGNLSSSTKPVLRLNDNPAGIMKTSIPVLSQN